MTLLRLFFVSLLLVREQGVHIFEQRPWPKLTKSIGAALQNGNLSNVAITLYVDSMVSLAWW